MAICLWLFLYLSFSFYFLIMLNELITNMNTQTAVFHKIMFHKVLISNHSTPSFVLFLANTVLKWTFNSSNTLVQNNKTRLTYIGHG